ncbi:hypothetical protein AXG93_4689s1380 [Marchantia polymorpha subsp. ruderalis]|uniref:F-actin-capping protein subunit alpha n=1 Tax=Marchantia polymorpha subsp. ruderalis TaxID=1480154 RepID=A0A176WLY1_MARPO|nr:hypothetical protein AXG93_4689s1380 [Marchantia polymorpha subsp. ruderalis]
MANHYEDEDDTVELDDFQKVSLAKWFLQNAPSEEMQHVAKDVREVLTNDRLYDQAAAEAFPEYNLKEMISLEMPNGTGQHEEIGFESASEKSSSSFTPFCGNGMGSCAPAMWWQVLVSRYGEVDGSHYLDPRTAQVAAVDHVKQICKSVRPASDDELPSNYVEQYRASVDAEVLKYVEEAYPRGSCSVYCTNGKNNHGDGGEFELTVVISTSSFSPKNFRGGRWRSVWTVELNEENESVELRGHIHVNAHYFEEGNVQLATSYECSDSTVMQDVIETGVSIVAVIRHQESEYLAALEDKYSTLSDTTFKELRRKLPVTRTQFSWDNALQLSLSREAARQISMSSRVQSLARVEEV